LNSVGAPGRRSLSKSPACLLIQIVKIPAKGTDFTFCVRQIDAEIGRSASAEYIVVPQRPVVVQRQPSFADLVKVRLNIYIASKIMWAGCITRSREAANNIVEFCLWCGGLDRMKNKIFYFRLGRTVDRSRGIMVSSGGLSIIGGSLSAVYENHSCRNPLSLLESETRTSDTPIQARSSSLDASMLLFKDFVEAASEDFRDSSTALT
jgi:hypothetical protein